MNNFGRQALTPGTPVNYPTGTGWEFIQVINESPYLLGLNFSGLGSIDFPISHREDIYMPRGYTGSLVITPSNYGYTAAFVAAAPSAFVTVNGFGPGEIKNPQSVALARLNNVGNTVSGVAGTASNLNNTGNPAGTNIISSTVSGDAQQAFSVSNDGIVAIGDAAHGGSLSVVGPLTMTGNIQSATTGNLVLNGRGPAAAVQLQSSGFLFMQVDGNGVSIYNGSGTKVARFDTAGNLILKGTVTQNGSP